MKNVLSVYVEHLVVKGTLISITSTFIDKVIVNLHASSHVTPAIDDMTICRENCMAVNVGANPVECFFHLGSAN